VQRVSTDDRKFRQQTDVEGLVCAVYDALDALVSALEDPADRTDVSGSEPSSADSASDAVSMPGVGDE